MHRRGSRIWDGLLRRRYLLRTESSCSGHELHAHPITNKSSSKLFLDFYLKPTQKQPFLSALWCPCIIIANLEVSRKPEQFRVFYSVSKAAGRKKLVANTSRSRQTPVKPRFVLQPTTLWSGIGWLKCQRLRIFRKIGGNLLLMISPPH